jgi:lipopolysaccharide transport protein LptA
MKLHITLGSSYVAASALLTSIVSPSLLAPQSCTLVNFGSIPSAHAAPSNTPSPKSAATPSTNAKATPATPTTKTTVSNPLAATTSSEEFGKLPTNITSDTLVLHSEDRVFIYKGNVVVSQGDMQLVSKVLEGTYNEQNQIEKMVAKGEVVITKQEIKATCQKALYNAVEGTVTLTENPQLQQKDSVLTADRIKVFLAENRSEAEGNVRVTLIKPEDGNIGITLGTPTPKATAVSTPKFTTVNQPPSRDLPTPSPTKTPTTE